MLDQINKSIRTMAVESAAAGVFLMLVAFLVTYGYGFSIPTGAIMALAGVLVCHWVSLTLIYYIPGWVAMQHKEVNAAKQSLRSVRFIDSPWDLQKKLMGISDQNMPATPTLTNESLMYGALIMEEAAETFKALSAAMDSYLDSMGTNGMSLACSDPKWGLIGVHHQFRVMADELEQRSVFIRQHLEGSKFRWQLPEHLATELLDGTTDLAVVNCGFALATGLPGDQGYEEVARSNLSKANPETGRIDKTPDGKWIKGAGYVKPDLAKVLREQAEIEAILASTNDY